MYRVSLRFHGDLVFFLPPARRNAPIAASFKGRRSIKDLAESMGIPHVEIDMITAGGRPVDFTYIVTDGDAFDCYPYEASKQAAGAVHLIEPPRNDPRFICDVHLRKLARRLRLMGFDVLYHESIDDEEIARIAATENRIVLTRDRGLLHRKIITRGRIVRSDDPDVQITEAITRLSLRDLCDPFTRCMECNETIELIHLNGGTDNPDIDRIPVGVKVWCTEYYRCRGCRRIYWKGSHYEKLRERADSVLRQTDNHE